MKQRSRGAHFFFSSVHETHKVRITGSWTEGQRIAEFAYTFQLTPIPILLFGDRDKYSRRIVTV